VHGAGGVMHCLHVGIHTLSDTPAVAVKGTGER
jgi:hypothetical protein